MTWIAPDVERSEDYPERRNEAEQEMLRDLSGEIQRKSAARAAWS